MYHSHYYKLFVSLFIFLITQCLQAQIITTIAGVGHPGYSGDNGFATLAELDLPFGLALDSFDHLYISDSSNHVIRKINLSTGIISTIAGNGLAGFNGDGGSALLASLHLPTSIAISSSGDLYIADTANHRIRKVDRITGAISTIAGNGLPGFSGDGGPATAAQLSFPNHVAFDRLGHLYIADSDNDRIRKVDAITGIISTVAGSAIFGFLGDGGTATDAALLFPAGISVDDEGNLYIADSDNHRIRKVDVITGVISTLVGNGLEGFNGDGGFATEAELFTPANVCIDCQGNLYIADSDNQRIRKVNLKTGIISTVAGNGEIGYKGDHGLSILAELNYPQNVCIDCKGHLYIADTFNHVIRKVILNIDSNLDSSSIDYSDRKVLDSTQTLFPPDHVKGKQRKNHFATQADRVNIITWQVPLLGIIPVAYHIYRDRALTQLIKVVKAHYKKKFKFIDHYRKKQRSSYFIISVDANGNRSSPVNLIVKDKTHAASGI